MALDGVEELLTEGNQKADPKRTGFPNWLLGRDSNPDPAVNSRLLYQLSYRGIIADLAYNIGRSVFPPLSDKFAQ